MNQTRLDTNYEDVTQAPSPLPTPLIKPNFGGTQFWLNNPCVLIQHFNIIPNPHLTLNEKLNALTRLVLLITLGMIAFEFKYWYWFLIAGIILVLVMKIVGDSRCSGDDGREGREGFSLPPSYLDVGTYTSPTVVPAFAEEFQSPPPIYDIYDNYPEDTKFDEYRDERPIFGQYISSNRLQPYRAGELNNMELNSAQLYMLDNFSSDAIQHRGDLIRGYTNRINRLYKSGCYGDSLSPYNSY